MAAHRHWTDIGAPHLVGRLQLWWLLLVAICHSPTLLQRCWQAGGWQTVPAWAWSRRPVFLPACWSCWSRMLSWQVGSGRQSRGQSVVALTLAWGQPAEGSLHAPARAPALGVASSSSARSPRTHALLCHSLLPAAALGSCADTERVVVLANGRLDLEGSAQVCLGALFPRQRDAQAACLPQRATSFHAEAPACQAPLFTRCCSLINPACLIYGTPAGRLVLLLRSPCAQHVPNMLVRGLRGR